MTTLTHEVIEDLIEENCCHECEGVGKDNVCVRIEAIAELPSRFGDFHIVAFWNNRDEKEHVAIIKGEIRCSSRAADTRGRNGRDRTGHRSSQLSSRL